jgi:hypothetical protein
VLLIHVQTDVPLRGLYVTQGLARANLTGQLGAGEHLIPIGLYEGTYRWSLLETGTPNLYFRYRLESDEEWTFDVEAGHTNFPGTIIIEGAGWNRIWLRTVNRSAFAAAELEDGCPGLFATAPIRYSGPDDDAFLEHYREALASQRSPASPGAAPQP